LADQAQKTPIARSLEQFANRKVRGALDLMGQALPASVVTIVSSGIVKVKFELTNVPFTLPQITVPMIGSEYIRLPIQTGCKGLVIAADAYLGGMSGLGGGTADLTPRPNLSNLVFVPIGNSNWSTADDPNSVVIYGPDGVILRTLDKAASITIAETAITLKVGSSTFVLNSSGSTSDDGGTALAIVNSLFEAFFNAHVHSSSGAGPPTIPMSSTLLTQNFKAQ
jgi:hypothetical protein